jgi:hypothetical protein
MLRSFLTYIEGFAMFGNSRRSRLLIVAVGASFLVRLALPAARAASPDGITYSVTVKTSFGTTFQDCFRFDNPKLGLLTIDRLSAIEGPLVWSHAKPARVPKYWMAVTSVALGANAGFAFSGNSSGDHVVGKLCAEALYEQDDTYSLRGTPDPSCSVAAPADGENPYLR